MTSDTMPERLEPCPFCGEAPGAILGIPDRYTHSWDSKCILEGQQFTAAEWNTRPAPSSPPPSDREALIEALLPVLRWIKHFEAVPDLVAAPPDSKIVIASVAGAPAVTMGHLRRLAEVAALTSQEPSRSAGGRDAKD